MSKTTKTANTMLETVRIEVDRETEQIVDRLTDSLQAAAQHEPAWALSLRSELGRMVSRQHFDQSEQAAEHRLQVLERRLQEVSSTLDTVRLVMDRGAEQTVKLTESLRAEAQHEPVWALELRGELGKLVTQQHFEQSGQALEHRLQALEQRVLEQADTPRMLERLDSLLLRMDVQAGLLKEQKRMLEEQGTRLRRLERPWYQRIFK